MAISDVFIVMPFEAETVVYEDGERVEYPDVHFNDLYEHLKDYVKAYDDEIAVSRMEKKYGDLVGHIIRRLFTADLVIAVLTGRNANVFYELGIRHALKRRTIMLVSDRRDYPFDLQGYYSEEYSIDTLEDRESLESFIQNQLEKYDRSELDDSPVLDELEREERAQWRALNHWETRRAAVTLRGQIGVIDTLKQWSDATIAFTNNVEDVKEGNKTVDELPPLKRPDYAALQSFGAQHPVPGLPSQAYVDASNLETIITPKESTVTELGAEIKGLLRQDDALGEEITEKRRAFAALSADINCRWMLYALDVLEALEYVVRERKCYNIPWSGRLKEAEDLDIGDEYGDLRDQFNERVANVLPLYYEFEDAFSGAPPQP